MANRKQQRRRQKLQRHEYEEVYVDEEGNELDPDEAEQLVAASPARKAQKAKTTGGDNRRAVEPPSWRKTLRRGLIFFPLMLGAIFLLSPELTTLQKVMNTLVLMAFFIPFSYFMDTMMWRSMQRRLAREGEKKP
jgi:antibiotic biosynthesis monooxygenase (ABM) superfamily enzyme